MADQIAYAEPGQFAHGHQVRATGRMSPLLLEGLSDAIGFVGGALLGFWIGQLAGFDIFAAGYGNGSIFGILLVGLGGGGGLQLARAWRRKRMNEKD